MKGVYPAVKDRGHGTKGGARALLLKGFGVKYQECLSLKSPEVEVVCSHAVYEGLEWCCCDC